MTLEDKVKLLSKALEPPFADLLEDPEEFPDDTFEAHVMVDDIKIAKLALELTHEG